MFHGASSCAAIVVEMRLLCAGIKSQAGFTARRRRSPQARRDNNNLTSRKRYPCKATNSSTEKRYIQSLAFRILIKPQTHGHKHERKHKSRESRQLYVESLAKLDTCVRDTLVCVSSAPLVGLRSCGAQFQVFYDAKSTFIPPRDDNGC